MRGETDLPRMLASLNPSRDPRRFVFASFPDMTADQALRFDPIGLFREAEGLTVIAEAQSITEQSGPSFAMITLNVHSSLEAVGLTAAVARALTENGISANVVAAAFHDHIFVPWDRADDAMAALRTLSETESRK